MWSRYDILSTLFWKGRVKGNYIKYMCHIKVMAHGS